MGKKKTKKNDQDEDPVVHSSKKSKKMKAHNSKEKYFQEKKKKKEKMDKLRVQDHPKKRHHKNPKSNNQNNDIPVDIHVASDLENENDESTFLSFQRNPTTTKKGYEIPKQSIDIPWMYDGKRYRDSNVFLCLHEEILDFVKFLSPTTIEIAARHALVETMQEIVGSLWTGAKIETFGSQLTEMFLPSSDIDMVVLNGPDGKHPLHVLARHLEEHGLVSYLEVIDSARIPIVKFVHKESGLHVDVSFGATSGFSTADLVMLYQRKYPAFRPLTLVLKYFLQQRGLNETFKGGVGSFLLQLMVVSFLQQTTRISPNNSAFLDLGHLLVGFFDHYGNIFNSSDLSISLRDGGYYFKKTDNEWKNYSRPELLSIENPHDPSHDVGSNSYEVRRVLKVFSHAAKVLNSEISYRGCVDRNHDEYGCSILEKIIALDDMLMTREGPSKFGYRILKHDPNEIKLITKRYETREI